jgi:hypothetical protein
MQPPRLRRPDGAACNRAGKPGTAASILEAGVTGRRRAADRGTGAEPMRHGHAGGSARAAGRQAGQGRRARPPEAGQRTAHRAPRAADDARLGAAARRRNDARPAPSSHLAPAGRGSTGGGRPPPPADSTLRSSYSKDKENQIRMGSSNALRDARIALSCARANCGVRRGGCGACGLAGRRRLTAHPGNVPEWAAGLGPAVQTPSLEFAVIRARNAEKRE